MNNIASHVLTPNIDSTESLVMDFADKLTVEQQLKLRSILEQGLPHVSQPYLAIAQQIDAEEAQVISQINLWHETGLIKRFGLVVKHRKLGFTANAMVVWNIPDELVEDIAAKLSSCPEVSLCYQRPRRLPHWTYNLFCMIHGMEREIVLKQISDIVEKFSLENIDKDVLFSFKAYKQQGARYMKKAVSHE